MKQRKTKDKKRVEKDPIGRLTGKPICLTRYLLLREVHEVRGAAARGDDPPNDYYFLSTHAKFSPEQNQKNSPIISGSQSSRHSASSHIHSIFAILTEISISYVPGALGTLHKRLRLG